MDLKDKEILLLIDSHALIHRAFHAFPDDLTTADGEVVNAVYGFARLLLEVLAKFKPKYAVATFDAPGPTVRHDQYAAYKANRSAPDDLLLDQIPRIEELLNVFDIPILRVEGYEADDIIGTLDDRHAGDGHLTVIVTGDKDLFQLVDEDTAVYLAGTSFSKSKLYEADDVVDKMGVAPEHIVDIKGLQGDPSDNIPGVAGIGAKGAVKLIDEFGTIENIFDSLEEVESRYQKKLANNYEMAMKSKELATIIKDAPVSFDFKQADFGTFDKYGLVSFFQDMEFNSLIRKVEELSKEVLPKKEDGQQQSMFDSENNDGNSGDIAEWDVEQPLNTEVFVHGEYITEGDPLQWRLANLHVVSGGKLSRVKGKKLAKFVGEVNKSVKMLVSTDSKALLHVVLNEGLELKPVLHDMVISTYFLSGGRARKDLDGVISYYQEKAVNFSEKLLALEGTYKAQKSQIEKDATQGDLVELERDLLPVVVSMERNGILLNKDILSVYEETIQEAIDDVQKDIFKIVGHEFNVSSPKQVGEVLFDEMGLPSGKKTKTGAYSTDKRTLRDLIDVDPVIEKILSYRELTKIQSTYVKPLPELVNEETGRIHAQFNQAGAVTGRFSSQYPNMQNIPLGESAGVNLRDAFEAEEGSVLIAFDYSQQELRLLAEFSKEPTMSDAFKNGLDIHAATAAEIFDVDIDNVTKQQRKTAKTINFGIIYGMSAYGFSDRLKVDVKKANEFIDKYFGEYPEVKKYYKKLLDEAKEKGYVETILHRRRSALDLRSKNYRLRSATEREIMNFPLQGSAADIIKLAMVEVQPILEDFPAKLLLQVHDELIFEYRTKYPQKDLRKDKKLLDFVRKVRQTMLGVVELKVPFEVGVDVGVNWGKLKPLEI